MINIDFDKQNFEIDKRYNFTIIIDKEKKKSYNSTEINCIHQIDSRCDFEIYF